MHDHTTLIIAIFLAVGVTLFVWLGRSLRARKQWAVSAGSPVLAFGVGMAVLFSAAYTQEFCHRKLQICLATSDTTVWNFVVYPVLCLPIYWLLIVAVRGRDL